MKKSLLFLMLSCSAFLLISLGYPTESSAVTFGAATTYPVGTSPSAVVVGDFNGDGKPDLAVANSGSGTVSILLGNGDGTFQAAVNSPAGPAPSLLIAGDFNGDHKLDLIVLSPGNPSTNTPGAVMVLLGKGDGTFQAPVQLSTSQFPVSVAVGDFNGDGKLDLIVSDTSGTALSVFLGNGDGTFQPTITFSLPVGVNGSFVVADFNNDTKSDLAIVGLGSIHIFLGNGDGTFQAPTTVTVGQPATQVQVADINHDGKVDLVVTSAKSTTIRFCTRGGCFTLTTTSDHISLLLGNGNGSFQAEQVLASAVWSVNSSTNFHRFFLGSKLIGPALLGDFNGDSKLDFGYMVSPAMNPSEHFLQVLLGKGDGTFSPSVVNVLSNSVLAVADLNSDGNSDLVVFESGDNIGVALNTSPTTGADMGIISAGANPNPVGVATNLTYTANLLNEGPQDATNVTFTDTLPNGVSFVSAMPTQGSCVQALLVVTCNLGGLASAFSTQVTMIVTPTAPATLTNQMSVTATQPDLVPGNNTATQITTAVPVYTLRVAKTGNGSGVVQAAPAGIDDTINCGITCSAKYLSGTQVLISATPDASSILANWSGACSGNSNPCFITIDADKSVTANLVPGGTLSVTVAGTGSGNVTSNPGGINCGSAAALCSAGYTQGTAVTLTAAPAANSTFGGWSGACTGSDPNTCNVTMNSSQGVTATFTTLQFSFSPGAASVTMLPNAQATDVLTFAALGGFSGSIALSCSVMGPAPLATCALMPSSVAPGANPAVSASTLTISAPALAAGLKPYSPGQISRSLYAAFLPIPGLALIGLGLRAAKSKERRRTLWLLCGLTFTFIALQVGCGGGSSTQNQLSPQVYTVTVTANTGVTQQSTNIAVTVQ